jgi:hypothetical protein
MIEATARPCARVVGDPPTMPLLLLRAIITGFGYKLGTELGRYVIDRFGPKKPAEAKVDASEEMPEAVPTDPVPPEVPAR